MTESMFSTVPLVSRVHAVICDIKNMLYMISYAFYNLISAFVYHAPDSVRPATA